MSIDKDIPDGNDFDDVMARAKERFKVAQERESTNNELYRDDMRFLAGDSDNQYQWPESLRNVRQATQRPMLTVNKTHQHWLMIVNDMKQNAPSIKVSPVGSFATVEAAKGMQAIIRHIERRSQAKYAYDKAAETQVGGGIGYWRIVQEYVTDNGFEQELRIVPVPDPLDVLMDPEIKKTDGSDARFCFVYVRMPIKEFREKYPDEDPTSVSMDLASDSDVWLNRDSITVAEYYELRQAKDWAYAVPHQDRQGYGYVLWSDMDDKQRDFIKTEPAGQILKRRRVYRKELHWYLIAGSSVIDHRKLPGKYIPVVRVPGEEFLIDDKTERKGIVRYLKDPQRMYNYNTSAQIEYGALQSKTPWVAALQSIDGLEDYWRTANATNHAVLPYNAFDDQGNPLPPPARQDPPAAAPAYLEAMQAAAQEMQMVSGQYEAQMGDQGNEISGIAITNRVRQTGLASYHFVSNQAAAVGYTARILIDLIPHIYDTHRVFRIEEDDGGITEVTASPTANQAHSEEASELTRIVFNPGVGDYEVVAEVGPSWSTRRQEAWESITNIITKAPELMQSIGDLAFKSADFPLADEIAERLRRGINPALLGDGPTPQEQQLQQQLQLAQKQLEIAQHKIMQMQLEAKDKSGALALDAHRLAMEAHSESQHRQIDAYEAETVRLRELARMHGDQRQIGQIERTGIANEKA